MSAELFVPTEGAIIRNSLRTWRAERERLRQLHRQDPRESTAVALAQAEQRIKELVGQQRRLRAAPPS